MASEYQYINVPKGLAPEVAAYLQTLQNLLMDVAGYRNVERRAVRVSEALRWLNEGRLWPEVMPGTAKHGETARIGKYAGKPLVIVSGFEIPCVEGGTMAAKIKNLRPENDGWVFEVEAACAKDGALLPGSLEWLAIGGRNNA